jgi:5-methylcytosine-specific restriction endonuclease McrA
MDHLLPQSLGGSDDDWNLTLACHRCNERHYNFTTGIDLETQEIVSLFNPRQQQWADHFVWTTDGLKIRGVTKTGRATCQRLDFNDDKHDDAAILTARWFWIQGGWHPPIDDPIVVN